MSAWILKLQGLDSHPLNLAVTGIPVRQKKAFQAICSARGLPALLVEAGLTPCCPIKSLVRIATGGS